MRRQVKPFVTEYRGGTRRTKDTGGDLQADTHRHRAYDEAQKFFQPDPTSPDSGHAESSQPDYGEDSYDAALRAADALFAAPVRPIAQPQIAHPSVAHRPVAVERAALEPVASEPWPDRHQPHFDDWPGVAPADEALADKAASAAPRRILQAIEPQGEDRFAALEAERAPKRRGRKPGSKNKPKVAVGDDWPETAVAASRPSMTRSMPKSSMSTPEPLSPARFVAALEPATMGAASANDDRFEDDVVDARVDGEGPIAEGEASGPSQKTRNDRFIRKREGLRPGERWKRRLPKAAW